MSVGILFFALVSFVAAQCSLETTAYQRGDYTLFLGARVGDWIPVITYLNDDGDRQAWFQTWTPGAVNTLRFDVAEYGSVGRLPHCDASVVGHYKAVFSSDCETLTLALLSDHCFRRTEFFPEEWTKIANVLPGTGDCGLYEGTLNKSTLSPRLSGETVSIFAAFGGLRIHSYGNVGAGFVEWTSGQDKGVKNMQDILTIPAPFACENRLYGQYHLRSVSTGSCLVKFCGVADTCPSRASLLDGVAMNGYQGSDCPAPVEVIRPNSACSPDNQPWPEHKSVDQCTSIGGGSQCAYCHGVANNKDVVSCIERNGATCSDIFRSGWRKSFCNLEFECPASTFSFSFLFAAVLALLALLF